MSVQVFRLRNVPDDEAEDIRNLLTEHHIDYYETPPGNWGISMPAIWLNDDEQLEEAKLLIEKYQHERQTRVRHEYEQSKKSVRLGVFSREWFNNPVQFVIYIAIAAVVLYFSIKPFLNFGQ